MDYVRLAIITVVTSLLLGFGYAGYSKVKDIGFQEAKALCELNFKKYEEERDAKIAEVEASSRSLVAENQKTADRLTQKMSATIKQLKNQPLVIVKENKCELTETFSGSFAKINQTVNESMKGNQK